MLIDELDKEPNDKFGYGVRYHKVLAFGEFLSSCTLLATRLSDSVDVSATFLVSTSATIPSGTSTNGSKTTIINTAVNHGQTGWKAGDWVMNASRGWMAQIKDIRMTTNPNHTLVFDEQAVAAGAGDTYYCQKAIATLQAGATGERIKVRFRAVTSLANQFEDDILVNVKDF